MKGRNLPYPLLGGHSLKWWFICNFNELNANDALTKSIEDESLIFFPACGRLRTSYVQITRSTGNWPTSSAEHWKLQPRTEVLGSFVHFTFPSPPLPSALNNVGFRQA